MRFVLRGTLHHTKPIIYAHATPHRTDFVIKRKCDEETRYISAMVMGKTALVWHLLFLDDANSR